jgi:hypothetical protein
MSAPELWTIAELAVPGTSDGKLARPTATSLEYLIIFSASEASRSALHVGIAPANAVDQGSQSNNRKRCDKDDPDQ